MSGVHPGILVTLGHPHALVTKEDGDPLNRYSGHQELDSKNISKPMGVPAKPCQPNRDDLPVRHPVHKLANH